MKYRGKKLSKFQPGGEVPYWMKRSSDISQRGNPQLQSQIPIDKKPGKRQQSISQDNRTPKQKELDRQAYLQKLKYEKEVLGRDFNMPTSLIEKNREQAEDIIHDLVDVPTTLIGAGELGYALGKGLLRGISKLTTPRSSQQITRGPIDWADTPGFRERNPGLNPRDYENTVKPGYVPPAEDPKLKAFIKSNVDISKNLEDLKFANDFAKKYGYEFPSNIERIASSNELTNRTIRGMMNRHNTFVRGVSTNWKFLEEKNPEILRHLEGKGFDLSTEEGSKAAAEYMATHIPIRTGYGRADLNTKVFNKGMDGLYTSNSIPTAEGYTYGQGYITKVKRPTDFSSTNRQDWINKNNPSYYNDFLPSGRVFSTSDLNKMTRIDADRLLNEARINSDEHQRMLKYFDQSKNKKKELMNKYQINQSSSIDDSKFDNYMNELETERNNIAQTIFDEDYTKKILRTERAPEFDANSRFTFNKRINEFIKSKGKDPMSSIKGTEEGEKVYRDIIEIQKNPLNSNQRVIDYIKTNYPDFDLQNRYAHYIHIGVPGQKVLEPIKSWKITPEIWKNKSRAHTNVYSKKLSALQQGGPIVSKYGQWKYPGQDTIVPTEDGSITMQGVPYPVLGIDETGFQQLMMPGGEYQFIGNSVYEKPLGKMQKGGMSYEDWKKKYNLLKSDATNYNLRRAWELGYVPNNGHLPSVDNQTLQWLKSKDHPTLRKELEWYKGNSPEAIKFRGQYNIDSSGQYWKYVPKMQKGGEKKSDMINTIPIYSSIENPKDPNSFVSRHSDIIQPSIHGADRFGVPTYLCKGLGCVQKANELVEKLRVSSKSAYLNSPEQSKINLGAPLSTPTTPTNEQVKNYPYFEGDINSGSLDSWDFPHVAPDKNIIFSAVPKGSKGQLPSDIYDKMLDVKEVTSGNIKVPIGSYINLGTKVINTSDKSTRVGGMHTVRVVGYLENGEPIVADNGEVRPLSQAFRSGGKSIFSIISDPGSENYTFDYLNNKRKAASTPSSEKYLSNFEGKSKDFKVFHDTISREKNYITNVLKISPEEYDKYAKIAMSLAGVETDFGNSPVYKYLGLFKQSKGPAQLREDNVHEGYNKTLSRYKKGSPEYNAMATILYINDLNKRKSNWEKKGETNVERPYIIQDEAPIKDMVRGIQGNKQRGYISKSAGKMMFGDIRDEFRYEKGTLQLPLKQPWQSEESYKKEVNDYLNKKDPELRFDFKDGKRVIYKKTHGNMKDMSLEDFIFYGWQSPSSIIYGDASGNSEYYKKAKDTYNNLFGQKMYGGNIRGKLKYGGLPKREWGGEEEIDTEELNFLMGSSFEEEPITEQKLQVDIDSARKLKILQEKNNMILEELENQKRLASYYKILADDDYTIGEETVPIKTVMDTPSLSSLSLSLRPKTSTLSLSTPSPTSTKSLSRFGKDYEDIDPLVVAATEELLTKFPHLKLTSGRRNWGDKDAHPKGRAVDLSYDKEAFDYYKNVLVPKYGFNPALDPNHGTGPHIHLGYY